MVNLLKTRLVGGFPYLGQCDCAMEPVEYAEGQGNPLDDGPRHEAVEVQLNLNEIKVILAVKK